MHEDSCPLLKLYEIIANKLLAKRNAKLVGIK